MDDRPSRIKANRKKIAAKKEPFCSARKWPVRQASENEHRNTRNLSHFDSSLNWTTLLREQNRFYN